MKLKFLTEEVNGDGRIKYKDLEIVPSHIELHYGGMTKDINSAYIVFKSKAKLDNGNLMDIVAYCDDENGSPVTFSSVQEAKDYLDKYYDVLELDVRDEFRGTEFHLVPNMNKEDGLDRNE
jgi:hypothetical protein